MRELIQRGKLDLKKTDRNGNLLCNHRYIHGTWKKGFIDFLTGNNLPHPLAVVKGQGWGNDFFTLAPDDVPNAPIPVTAQTPQPSHDTNRTPDAQPDIHPASVHATNYKLWLASAALAIAAVGIYKWYTHKKKTAVENKYDENDEQPAEIQKQITA